MWWRGVLYEYAPMRTYKHIHIYIYIYICIWPRAKTPTPNAESFKPTFQPKQTPKVTVKRHQKGTPDDPICAQVFSKWSWEVSLETLFSDSHALPQRKKSIREERSSRPWMHSHRCSADSPRTLRTPLQPPSAWKKLFRMQNRNQSPSQKPKKKWTRHSTSAVSLQTFRKPPRPPMHCVCQLTDLSKDIHKVWCSKQQKTMVVRHLCFKDIGFATMHSGSVGTQNANYVKGFCKSRFANINWTQDIGKGVTQDCMNYKL